MDQAGPARKEPLLNSWLLLFLFAMILANIGGAMYDPILPLYLQQLDATIADVGWFFTLSRILPLAMLILGGYISDSLGRLRSIAMGSIAGVFVSGYVLVDHLGLNAIFRGTGALTVGLGVLSLIIDRWLAPAESN